MLIAGGAGGGNGADSVIALFDRVTPVGGLDYIVTSHYDIDHFQGLDDVYFGGSGDTAVSGDLPVTR